MKRKLFYILSVLLILCGVAYAVDMKGDYKFVGPTVDFTNTTVTGISSTSAHTAIVTITKEDATTNTVTDYITSVHTTSGTVAAGFGTGISFDMEDAGGTEEQAAFDAVFTTVTDGQEDVDLVWYQNDNGALLETLRMVADADGAAAGTRMQITSTSAETNGVVYPLVMLQSGGTVAAGFGIGIDFKIEDAGGIETQGMLEYVFTDKTDSAEDADFVIKQNDNGTMRETLRIIADNDGTTEGTRLQITSTSAETNGVNHTLVLKAEGGTTVAGFGNGIDLQGEFDDDTETMCQLEAVWTDVGTGSEDADFVVNCKDAGATTEVFRVNSDGQIETSKVRTITAVNTAAALLTTADCGATIFLNHATVAIDSVLPAVAGSNGCEFTWVQMLASAVDNTIQTDSGEDKIVVQFFIADGNAGAAADVNADTVTYNNAADAVGDTCRAVSNGLFWHMQCNGAANGAFSSSTT